MDRQARVSAARALTDEQLEAALHRGHASHCRHVRSDGSSACNCGFSEAKIENNRRHTAMLAETMRAPEARGAA